VTTPDEYPRALRSAEAAATAWKQAVEHQQDATPQHADFYALAGEMVATLYALDDLTVVLARQVGDYGQGRALYDDTRTVDPAERLTEAVAALRAVHTALGAVTPVVHALWNAIGHIGVEATP
jgi:hypothetical protein